ncbi:hypothetical protein APUTEX25_002279 [Auxenochlorella protothecoides]|uniref:Uncharacterized protein n=1 Tax=Auxenochlorella protothecoides TaxID=3075 RepID=A0A3M7L383_AUXPR|nr:hypothetical protein APUTEX25_002279 [Auxenochlorella protothecoides]|eukprot:RMZ57047.1 hypothetical protein APUTEX25_002279 [Auxenochlorella protothecoides]
MGREQVMIKVSSGHSLEGDIYRKTPSLHGVGVLVLHPYAYLGGSMRDPVVTELFGCLCRSSWTSVILRYNQRGVGASTGYRQPRGSGDFQDVLDVLDYLAGTLPPGTNKRLVVVGYSWGCCVAAHALRHPLIAAYVGVSFPLSGLSMILGTKGHFEELGGTRHLPRLLITGSQDQFSGEAQLMQSLTKAGGRLLEDDDSFQVVGTSGAPAPTPGGAAAAPLLLRVWAGADHFWLDQVAAMAEYVNDWLRGTLAAAGAAEDGAAITAFSQAARA